MKILLLCNAGSSTGMLAEKMIQYTKENGLNYEIKAVSVPEGKQMGSEWDVLLLGPQVGYEVKPVQKIFPDKKVTSVPPQLYGLMDGAGVVKFVEELVK